MKVVKMAAEGSATSKLLTILEVAISTVTDKRVVVDRGVRDRDLAALTMTTQSTTVRRGTLTSRGTTTRERSLVGVEVGVRLAVTSKDTTTRILAHNLQAATLRVVEVEDAVFLQETKNREDRRTQEVINSIWAIERIIMQTRQKTTRVAAVDNKNPNLYRRWRKIPPSRNSKMNGPISSAKRSKRRAMESLLTIYTSCAWPKAKSRWVLCRRILISRHPSSTRAPNLTSQRISPAARFPKI